MAEYFSSSNETDVKATESSTTSSNIDKTLLLDTPITAGFENYVRSCFRPGAKLPTLLATDQGVSATRMLQMEDTFGPSALDETYDDDPLRDPLEKLYSEMGLSSFLSSSFSTNNCLRHYPVYTPKQSSEYYSTLFSRSKHDHNDDDLLLSSRNYKKEKENADAEWRKNNRQIIIDYKNFDSPRLSPYMYQEHPYVRSQDSRIVGSNFVQITTRPKDNFLEKVDKTLAEVRAMPRF